MKEILGRFKMQHSKPAPPAPGSKIRFPKAEDNQEEIAYPYREAVGALMFSVTTTRPDIMSAVASVARFSSNSSAEHVVAVKRVLRYLGGLLTRGSRWAETARLPWSLMLTPTWATTISTEYLTRVSCVFTAG